MKTSIAVISPVIIVLSFQFQTPLLSQVLCDHPETRTWIRVEDAHGNFDTLWFGYSVDGSCGYDPVACEDWVIEPCGPPVEIFCTWWKVCEDSYVLKTFNYHEANRLLDTFQLGFSPGPPGSGFPVRITWSRADVAALFDSAVMRDPFGGMFYHARMDVDSTLLLENTLFHDLYIYTDGLPIADRPDEKYFVPDRTRLLQNYPNPFNPTTTITFELEETEMVIVSISDVLGQVVETLVNGQKIAGTHTVVWNAEDVPGGVYFCRFMTPDKTETTKLVLIR